MKSRQHTAAAGSALIGPEGVKKFEIWRGFPLRWNFDSHESRFRDWLASTLRPATGCFVLKKAAPDSSTGLSKRKYFLVVVPVRCQPVCWRQFDFGGRPVRLWAVCQVEAGELEQLETQDEQTLNR